jgi:hypothetical protein
MNIFAHSSVLVFIMSMINLAFPFLAAGMFISLGVVEAAPETASPARVLELVEQARTQSAAKDWKEAARLWGEVVRMNPVQSSYWYSLGGARYQAGEFKEAAKAYEKSAELGSPVGSYNAIYNAACSYALAGEKEPAIKALVSAYELGFPDFQQMITDPDLASVQNDPRIIELLSIKDTSKMSRDEGWRYDLSLLAREVRRKGFNPHLDFNRAITVDAFDREVQALDATIPSMTDGQVVLGMAKLMASLGDGHSGVWDVGENPLWRKALPLRFFWFEEGLFVTAADSVHRDLLGAHVLAFDGKPTKEVLKALEPYESKDRGNQIWGRTGAPYRVRRLTLLHAAGLIKSPDEVNLTILRTSGKKADVVVASVDKETNIWNTLPAPASWVTFSSTLKSPPLYLQHMDVPQWFQYLPDQKTVYFQWNLVRNAKNKTIAQFSDSLFQFINANPVEKLIIDMRWNNGGNTFLGQPLLLNLIKCEKINQKGRLFVIIGRRTYSAAQNMATYFGRYTNATFVGEPTGSSPNFIGEEDPITLPYSKVMANVSHLYWQSSWPQDQRMWVAPDIYVPPTFADFQAGRDAALLAVLGLP